jgi:hypothetical protein
MFIVAITMVLTREGIPYLVIVVPENKWYKVDGIANML